MQPIGMGHVSLPLVCEHHLFLSSFWQPVFKLFRPLLMLSTVAPQLIFSDHHASPICLIPWQLRLLFWASILQGWCRLNYHYGFHHNPGLRTTKGISDFYQSRCKYLNEYWILPINSKCLDIAREVKQAWLNPVNTFFTFFIGNNHALYKEWVKKLRWFPFHFCHDPCEHISKQGQRPKRQGKEEEKRVKYLYIHMWYTCKGSHANRKQWQTNKRREKQNKWKSEEESQSDRGRQNLWQINRGKQINDQREKEYGTIGDRWYRRDEGDFVGRLKTTKLPSNTHTPDSSAAMLLYLLMSLTSVITIDYIVFHLRNYT